MFDDVQMCFSWYPSNSHYFLASNSWREEHHWCICVHLSTQESVNHVVCLCIWFLLISANLLPVYLSHFLNCPLPFDKDNFQTQFIFVLNESSSKFDINCVKKSYISFFSFPFLFSPVHFAAWRCGVAVSGPGPHLPPLLLILALLPATQE